MSENDLVKGGTWEPERIKWGHHKIESYIKDNWEDKNDEELADGLSELTGKNVSQAKTKKKRLEMGIKRPKHLLDHSICHKGNTGVESVIDWKASSVKKYIQVRYKDVGDIELAEGLSKRYDEDVTWKMVRRHRLRMGYKRGPNPKRDKVELSTRERRKFIFDNHPKFNGDYETINRFLVAFKKKFNVSSNIRSIKRRMAEFIKHDYGLPNFQEIRLSDESGDKIARWLRD